MLLSTFIQFAAICWLICEIGEFVRKRSLYLQQCRLYWIVWTLGWLTAALALRLLDLTIGT